MADDPVFSLGIFRYTTKMTFTKHGAHQTPEYEAWTAMRQRCLNPNCRSYVRYGGRGIRVDQRWDKFENFLADMGPRQPSFSLDRINNDGNYEPDNCRWTNRLTQSRNTRRNSFITYDGRTQCLEAWRHELGFSRGVLSGRLTRGWTVERALTTPSQEKPRKPLTYEGRTQSLRAWNDEFGLPHGVLRKRLARGWPIEKALITPALR